MYNAGQELVIEEAVRAFKRKDPLFQFSGGPGTGKSYVLNRIVSRLGIDRNRIAPMSYIGQAAIVMRLKGFHNAKTIHSWLFTPSKIPMTNEYGVLFNKYLGVVEDGFKFIPKSLDNIDLIIVDEAGSCPLKLRKYIENTNIPVIATGDINQLPPVADEPAYLTDPSNIIFLTENMRQKQGSNIPYLAQRALDGLPIQLGYYGDALVIKESNLTNDILAGANIVLCGTNKTRERINKLIREEILGLRMDLPQYGEKIICRKNDWSISVDGIGLGNGIIGKIVSPVDVTSFNGNYFTVDFMPDLFNGIFYNLDINYEYFTAPYEKKQEVKAKMLKYHIPGHCFDFAYCITTHLSQGAEYPNVIYFDEGDIFPPDINNRLRFTAITRASQNLIYVKIPKKRYYSVNM